MIQANLLLSRPFIKINACLIGYGMWMLFSQHQIITSTIKAPVCFYQVPENFTLNGPDSIDIVVSASKKTLRRFDVYNSAIHLDASQFNTGNNHIVLQKENLFLPDEINLVNLIPASIKVQLQKQKIE